VDARRFLVLKGLADILFLKGHLRLSSLINESTKMNKDPQTHEIIGAAMEVHRELGHGFLENVYKKALALEFDNRKIIHAQELDLNVSYKGQPLNVKYRADFVCFGDIIVELKALKEIRGSEEAQLLNYLKATGFRRGLIINFGTSSLKFKRMVNGY
jgi:GxxExxY protein